MATSNEQVSKSYFERSKKPIATILLAMGGLSLAACNASASAENAPETRPAATATAMPSTGETTTTAVPAETTPATAPEAHTQNAELQTLAAKVTPEKLRVMTPVQLKDALSVKTESLDKSNVINSYLEHYAVLVEAANKSGMTHEDWAAAVPDPNSMDDTAYYAYVNKKYADVFSGQLWGTNEGDYKFYDGLHQNYLNAVGGFAGYNGTPEGYDLHIKLDPSTIKVIDKGDGVNDAFTVEAGFKYTEVYDKEAVQQAMGAAAEPLHDTLTMVFHDVADGGDGVMRPSHVENVTK